MKHTFWAVPIAVLVALSSLAQTQNQPSPILLRAAHLLDIENGKLISPGEILIQGGRIAEVGSHVSQPSGAEIIDLGSVTLMPGLIDAHIHLFLHPGAEDLQ